MLSNRADVYNLGEIIGDASEAFEMSYLENCLTSNVGVVAVVRPRRRTMLGRSFVPRCGTPATALIWSPICRRIRSPRWFRVMKKLLRVRDAVLRVNRAYIRSAAQADAYRTEPPFKLQGSYRNMNRIAERVAAR